MAKTLNPVEAYRREQKKIELKKHRMERLKDKQVKISSMNPVEIREQLRNFERQVCANPADGPARKRKQELEDTLRAVVKKQRELADEERKKQMIAPPRPQSMAELTQANMKNFQNPRNSIYYHPTMNPFGAPPPGKPQMYRDMPSNSIVRAAPRGLPGQVGYHEHFVQRKSTDGGDAGASELPPLSIQQPREMARRPGKRPPLPDGPPPPRTIQVPSRPPLPSGVFPVRPPPPPPACARAGDRIVPQTMQLDVASPVSLKGYSVVPAYPTTNKNAGDSVVAPYPLAYKPSEDEDVDEEDAERAAKTRAQLRSLVPVALRVQHRMHAPSNHSVVKFGNAPPISASRRPLLTPLAPVPRPAVGVGVVSPPALVTSDAARSRSVSKEFGAFMEEVKELL